MKKREDRFLRMKIAWAFLALGLLVAGCSKEEPSAPLDPYNKPYSRMEDAAYTNALHSHIDKRNDIHKRMVQLENEIREAESKDAKSVEAEALRAKRKELMKEYDTNRAQTERLVRERILRESAAIEAREKRENTGK